MLEDMIKDTLEPTGKDNRTQRRKVCVFGTILDPRLMLTFNKALARDDFRCMVTGMLDRTLARRCQPLLDASLRERIKLGEVQTAHILNESTMQGIDPEGASKEGATMNKVRFPHYGSSPPFHSCIIQTQFAASAMAILDSFGFSKFTKAFRQSGGVHEVWNLLSLEPNLHKSFDLLEMWFEGTQKVHCSETCKSRQLTLCSHTAMKSVCYITQTRIISAATLCVLNLMSMALLWLSTLLHELRMRHRHPTTACLPFMQHVLGSLTCLVLLNSLIR